MAEAAAAAEAVLAGVILRGARGGDFAVAAADPAALELAILTSWSVVHGLTMLAIDGLASEAEVQLTGAGDLAEAVAQTLLHCLLQR